VADAAHLAELWLDAATTLPAGATRTEAWTANDWIENTIDTWKRLCDPVAQQVSGMWTAGLPDEARQVAGPMLGMLGQMGGYAFGSQLGQALGQLAQEVLTSTDIGLPLGPTGAAALLPKAISDFSAGLEQPEREILVYLAAREAAHQRLFHHVPWLRQQLLNAVEDYARGIKMDFSAIEDAAANLDPSALTDPAKLEEILQQSAIEPQTTPEQEQALARLETMLALIEGWVETVVTQALGDRLPGVPALTETLRRRRASGGPAEQTFATLVGLELRPRKLREAGELWRTLTEEAGIEARDGVWSHPDLLPDASDLDDPSAFVTRVAGGHSALDDPIAQLEKLEQADQNPPDDEPK
jgi:putative hydrolase